MMNTGEHTNSGVGLVQDEQKDRAAALITLRKRLTDGLARVRLNKTQLAAQAGLSRTTVQLAFQTDALIPPSAETVAALARVLRLPDNELLALRRTAAGDSAPVRGQGQGPGKMISEWNPHDLEVHPAGPAVRGHAIGGTRERVMPGYVFRAHDRVLADMVQEAAQGQSRMVVLVGSSSTGKTRSCWEAVQPLANERWRLWHPFDPTRAEAILDGLEHVMPRTVVWLNEAQHYLGHPRVGERVAAAVHGLLTQRRRGPVLILGTLWPNFANEYAIPPTSGKEDPHSRTRELLAGRTLTVPETFDQEALRMAAILAKGGDRLLAEVLTRATDGRVTQDLAGAPELLHRYANATAPARAVLHAAMDARRLGAKVHLPQAFLTEAAVDYLSDQDYDELTEDWVQSAFADLTRLVHGKQAPLRRTGDRPKRRPPANPRRSTVCVPEAATMFRLADYLEQHARNTRQAQCPPASFWHAAYSHLTDSDDLCRIADEAQSRHRLQWAHHLYHRAADAGSKDALSNLAWMRENSGDHEAAEALARQAGKVGDARALLEIAWSRELSGDDDSAEALYQQALAGGDVRGLTSLALMRQKVGDHDGAEALARQAAEAGDTYALAHLATMREKSGDHESAQALREEYGIQAEHETFTRWASRTRRASRLADVWSLLRLLAKSGDLDLAEPHAWEAAAAGEDQILVDLVSMQIESGDHDSARALALRAADADYGGPLLKLAQMREEAGDHASAEALYWHAASAGKAYALAELARMRRESGDLDGARALALRAAEAGYASSLVELAKMQEEAGDHNDAEFLYRQAIDAGEDGGVLNGYLRDRWPYGLDPDGTPTPPWS
ncbi:hypothetical protein [Streptomyces europaeiscabiei]|uniref:hypothetical protein n=1 Tax=Streptomyces europaeiscabiei TaxID=146819 RepID=UPI0029A665A8|nr:hypothetical protein [Streptomyces europaeiscabiei]MDX2530479.1 hypothetical protein [Streptomyces europaeiscabiei]